MSPRILEDISHYWKSSGVGRVRLIRKARRSISDKVYCLVPPLSLATNPKSGRFLVQLRLSSDTIRVGDQIFCQQPN
ncbi:MAG: hypothetical protein BECKG1743D_GA0114223_102234 [Candidatus Kentron sp. G]|nr:MAG: hypothetical protein BECKG1743E_GA0114224_100613 [Candidatus Kentron sp. G]VFM97121.1 MAG: hypothetical protein BECKG1743F_GA0114225_102223 [Candidatus Kentron sp. G]VFN00774.1 MAG: hypothetical protein BECKG1743D_GA0114223_102234 [Candidatus Kentron sp. G]